MLSIPELRLNYWALDLISKTGFSPFHFDPSNGESTFIRTGKELIVFKVRIHIFLVCTIWKVCRLLQSILHPELFHLQNSGLHVILSSFACMMFYELKCIIYNNRLACCFLVSQLHSRLPQKRGSVGFKSLAQHPLLDIMITTYPISISSCGVGSFLVYCYDPNACHLFYSALPHAQKTWPNLLLLMGGEIWFLAEMVSSAYWCGYVLLSYVGVHLTENKLGALKTRLRWNRSSEALLQFCKELQELLVEVNIYNHTFSNLTYVMKLEMLIISILGLFTGVRSFAEAPMLGSIYLFMGVYAILMFISFFGHSFRVEEGVGSVREILLGKTEGMQSSRQKKYLQRFLKAVPKCSIKAGEFYTLDRMTTPIFVGFVFSQVCSLLLAFG